MSRKPAVLAISQLEEAAKAAVAAAVEDRTVALTELEARNTSGGAVSTLDPIIFEPILLGVMIAPDPWPLEPALTLRA